MRFGNRTRFVNSFCYGCNSYGCNSFCSGCFRTGAADTEPDLNIASCADVVRLGICCATDIISEGPWSWSLPTSFSEVCPISCGDGNRPPPAQIQATVTYAIDIATIAEGSAERASFETGFKDTIVAALDGNIQATDVTINSITAGSVVVSFHPTSELHFLPAPARGHAFFYGAQLRTNIAGRCLAGRLHHHRAGTGTVKCACHVHRPGTGRSHGWGLYRHRGFYADRGGGTAQRQVPSKHEHGLRLDVPGRRSFGGCVPVTPRRIPLSTGSSAAKDI